MKRAPGRAWPKQIVEVPAARQDPRGIDPHATQKISREQLDEALRRTKSGTRRAVRSEPDLGEEFARELERNLGEEAFAGPRDDSPEVTIVRIDSVELDSLDPARLAAMNAAPPVVSPAMSALSGLSRPVVPTPPLSPISSRAIDLLTPDPHIPRISLSRLIQRRVELPRGLQITPRVAFVGGLTIAVLVLVAAVVGFVAGGGLLH